jgi:phage gpG-like protein
MGEQITVELRGEAVELLRKLEAFPRSVLPAAARAMDLQNQLTIGHIQENKLSQRGPTTLGVVTNRLRSSLRATKTTVVTDGLASTIGTNVRYAAVHEFGFEGPVTVKQHLRKNADRFSIDDGRRTVSKSQAGRLGLLTKAGKPRKGMADRVAGKETTVKEHVRKMKVPARKPIRTGIAERLPAYAKAMAEAVVKVLRGN